MLAYPTYRVSYCFILSDNCARTAIDDVAYTIRNDQKVPIVTQGDLYYPYTTIHGVYDVVCGALYPRTAN
jgi:hypothetical protein